MRAPNPYPSGGPGAAVVTEADGAAAVRLARAAIARALEPGAPRDAAQPFRSTELPAVFAEPRGVFVTLKRDADGTLRGCIGFPMPVFPLRAAIPRAAVAAAVEDPRFPPLRTRELATTRVEVSILSVPEPIATAIPSERLANVVVGRDGLIVDGEGASGLLLPQVPVEEGWDAETFLAQTCVKAGLRPEMWRSPQVRFRRFGAEVFAESRPEGPVARETLSGP